jgi:hypothetical protein
MKAWRRIAATAAEAEQYLRRSFKISPRPDFASLFVQGISLYFSPDIGELVYETGSRSIASSAAFGGVRSGSLGNSAWGW